jgi:hypothetical protein
MKPKEDITVVFTNRAYNAIISETFSKTPLETGGILLGHILSTGVWIVVEVIPPGPRSTFQHACFEYDWEFVNYLVKPLTELYQEELQILGPWHRHPGSMDTFSSTDDQTNYEFVKRNPYGVISGLVNIDPLFRLTMYHVKNSPIPMINSPKPEPSHTAQHTTSFNPLKYTTGLTNSLISKFARPIQYPKVQYEKLEVVVNEESIPPRLLQFKYSCYALQVKSRQNMYQNRNFDIKVIENVSKCGIWSK